VARCRRSRLGCCSWRAHYVRHCRPPGHGAAARPAAAARFPLVKRIRGTPAASCPRGCGSHPRPHRNAARGRIVSSSERTQRRQYQQHEDHARIQVFDRRCLRGHWLRWQLCVLRRRLHLRPMTRRTDTSATIVLPCYSGLTSRMRGSRCQLARHWESTVNLPLNMARDTKSWHIGTIQRGINRLAHTAHRGLLDSLVLALPLRRVENSSRGVARLKRIGQLSNRAARSPLHAPVAQIVNTRAGRRESAHPARGPASTSRDGWPNDGRHLFRSRGLLCRTKARYFQALPPARSVLSRELRRKGPVRCESRRGLATSETCRVLMVLLAVLPALRIRSDHPERRALRPILWQPQCMRTSSAH
jgi:hypothetical protein